MARTPSGGGRRSGSSWPRARNPVRLRLRLSRPCPTALAAARAGPGTNAVGEPTRIGLGAEAAGKPARASPRGGSVVGEDSDGSSSRSGTTSAIHRAIISAVHGPQGNGVTPARTKSVDIYRITSEMTRTSTSSDQIKEITSNSGSNRQLNMQPYESQPATSRHISERQFYFYDHTCSNSQIGGQTTGADVEDSMNLYDYNSTPRCNSDTSS